MDPPSRLPSHLRGHQARGGLLLGIGNDGRLGNGTLSSKTTPVLVAREHVFASVSVGDNHTCGVTEKGEAYCWGSGSNGRLGNGSTDVQAVPVPVSPPG